MTRALPRLALAGLLAASLGSGAASAHAFLQKASPGVGSTVSAAPATLWIDFTESVEPGFSRIEVIGPSGPVAGVGPVHAEGAAGSRLVVGLPPLAAGSYKVVWHAVATDTHRTEGSFGFTIRP